MWSFFYKEFEHVLLNGDEDPVKGEDEGEGEDKGEDKCEDEGEDKGEDKGEDEGEDEDEGKNKGEDEDEDEDEGEGEDKGEDSKYTEVVHSLNFDNRVLTTYVFFIGTLVWFNEVLAHLLNDGISSPLHVTMIASASYTASFAIGYFNVMRNIPRRLSLTAYILASYWWFHYNVPRIAPDIQKQLQVYDLTSKTETEHHAIAALSHSFAYVVGRVLYENNIDVSLYKRNIVEYASIIGLLYLIRGQFGSYLIVTLLSFVSAALATMHYGVFKHLNTNVISNLAVSKCPFYNDGALVLYQTYPVCASIVYIASLFFSSWNVTLTHMFRAFWYHSRELPARQFFIETLLLLPTLTSSRLFNYIYVVYSIPIITQILRNPIEVLNGCFALRDLYYTDSSNPTKFRDNILQIIHDRGAFRIPLMDASYIATTGIPKLISKRSGTSTTAPFVKAINDVAGVTLFSRETDEIWADLKKELRTCIQHPTFRMLDQSTDQFDVSVDKLSDWYKDDNGYEIFSRIITRIMMTDITGIEMTVESFEHCYDMYFKPQQEHMIGIMANMKHLDDSYALQLFKNMREMYKHCTKLRADGWLVRLLFKKHDISIDNIGELHKILDYANERLDIKLIHTINEATLMFMLAVPTTASLSSRCVHYLNYIRDTEPIIYNGLLESAREFYKTHKNKDDTLKKPINGDAWVDFVLNVLYWFPPTLVSVKLVRETVDIYQPGDIIIMSLNCDRDAPAPEDMQARYKYMTEHPQTKAGEALWQDDRVCAAAYFAQNETAFILAKLYSNYAVSIGEGVHKSYMVSRVDYHMCLHELDADDTGKKSEFHIVDK